MKITKFRWMRDLCRPGGMRGGTGGRLEGGLRSADLNLRIEICVMEFCFESDTPALVYDKGGGFNRYAHSAGPGYRRRELNLEQFGRKSIDEYRMASAWRSGESIDENLLRFGAIGIGVRSGME